MRTYIPGLKPGAAGTRRQPAAPALPDSARKLQWPAFIAALVLVDVIMIAIGFQLAYAVRFEANIGVFQLEVSQRQPFYQQLILIFIGVWLTAFAVMGLYNRHNLLGGTEEYARTFRASTYSLLLVIV